MERGKINYWVDVALVICLIVVAVTGLVLKFAFVSGEPGVGKRVTFLGTFKGDWLAPHEAIGTLMIILMVVHLILHWGVFKAMTRNYLLKKSSS